LPIATERLDAKVWISLLREIQGTLEKDRHIPLVKFLFRYGKSEVHGTNKVSDFGWSIGDNIYTKDRHVCFDSGGCGPRQLSFVVEEGGLN
jgi:hypothetical protein